MADEPTPAAWQRELDNVRQDVRGNLDAIRQDVRERYAAQGARLDAVPNQMVGLPVWQAHLEATRREHDELKQDIGALDARFEADQRQRAADRRLILMALFTSILAPLALLVVQTLLRSKGASP